MGYHPVSLTGFVTSLPGRVVRYLTGIALSRAYGRTADTLGSLNNDSQEERDTYATHADCELRCICAPDLSYGRLSVKTVAWMSEVAVSVA